MNRKKLLSIMVSVAILLSLCAGCADKTDDSVAAATTETQKTQAKATDAPEATPEEDPLASTEEKLTISWIGITDGNTIVDGNFVQTKIEDMFNVEIENSKVNIHEEEQVNLMLAAGEMPDAGFIYRNDSEIISMVENDILRTIPNSFIREYAPMCAEMYDNNPLAWTIKAVEGEEAQVALVGINETTEFLPSLSMYRMDWLENLGIIDDYFTDYEPLDADGKFFFTNESIDYTQLEEILTAFTFNDPNQSGKDDTFGMTGCAADSATKGLYATFNSILGMYGLTSQSGYNIEVDGKPQMTYVTEQFKEFSGLMTDWYGKGIIDPEMMTMNRSLMWEKIGAGNIGWWSIAFNYTDADFAATRPPQNVIANSPDAKVLITAPEYGPDGLRGVRSSRPVSALGNYFFIEKNVDDKTLARILMIYDYLNIDMEGYVLSNFGEEGVHFDWTGEPYKSQPVFREGITNTDYGFKFYNSVVRTMQQGMYFYGPLSMKMIDSLCGTEEGLALNLRPYKYDFFLETDYNDIINIHEQELETLWTEFLYRTMMGEIDLDSEWDAYVEKWLGAGGQELTDEMEKAPLVSDIRAGLVNQ